MPEHDATTRATTPSPTPWPPRRRARPRRAVGALLPALVVTGLAHPGLAQTVTQPGASPAAGAPGAPVAPVAVDETPAPPVSAPSKMLPGWKGLWAELPKTTADLRIALAEIERAEAATRIAVAALVPTLNGTVSLNYAPPKGGGAGSPFTLNGATMQAQLAARVPLVNVRNYYQIGTQELNEDIKHLEVREVRRKLGLALARGAASIAAASRITNANRISLDLALQRLALTRQRLNAGMGDTRDLVRAQQDVASARSVIAPADETLRQAQEGLAVLVGSKVPLGVDADLDALEGQIVAFCGGSGSSSGRVDVLIAQKQIDLAERNVTSITLKFLPSLDASGSLGTFGPAFGGPFKPGWSVGITLSIPIFDGGVRYGEKKDRVALVEIAKARAIQTEIAATVEKNQARRALEVAQLTYKSAKEARDLAAEADRLARVAYANGIGTNFELIDAGRKLREVEAQLVLRDLDVVKAKLALPFVEGACAGLEGK